MSSGEKNGSQARNGLEKISAVEDSIQKITSKVLPGIFSSNKVPTMAQDNSDKLSRESSKVDEEMELRHRCHESKRRKIIICAILLLCLAGALQGILVNGLINVVISTIEKR